MTKYGRLTLLAGLLIPVTAMAQVDVGESLGSSEAAIRAALESEGYAILEVEREGDEIEVEGRFGAWSLTDAERQVAILAIKGFSIAEIAALRETKQGTVKAQCASVYRKANVAGRLQLLSIFLDDLMADDLIGTASQTIKKGVS